MSWEEMSTKTVPCPCGKGTISQTEYGDDWNRYEYGPVEIHCPECKQKYKVESVYHPETHPGHGSWSSYFLTPIDYPAYSGIQESAIFGVAKSIADPEFSLYLVENYSFNDLIDAKSEYESKRSSAKVTGMAKQICNEHKWKFNSVKATLILTQINQAINQYSTHVGNYDQRMPVREQERKEKITYESEKRKHQIHLDL